MSADPCTDDPRPFLLKWMVVMMAWWALLLGLEQAGCLEFDPALSSSPSSEASDSPAQGSHDR